MLTVWHEKVPTCGEIDTTVGNGHEQVYDREFNKLEIVKPFHRVTELFQFQELNDLKGTFIRRKVEGKSADSADQDRVLIPMQLHAEPFSKISGTPKTLP
jgi:hypothetical protein